MAVITSLKTDCYDTTITTITDHNISHSRNAPIGNATGNQSWLLPRTQSAVATTSYQENSHAGNQLNHTENLHQESAGASAVDISYSQQARSSEKRPQNTSLSSIQHHTPPPHSITAAEIALGIASPFNTRDARAQQAMAHESRTQQVFTHSGGQRNIQSTTDIESVIESLADIKDRDEENTSRTSDTFLVTSPGRMTPLHDSSDHGGADIPRPGGMGIGTPSTVSTAPSTDDASHCTDYRLEDAFLPNLLQGTPEHSRSPSWGDEGLFPPGGTPQMPQLHDERGPWGSTSTPASLSPLRPWGVPHQQRQRVATFREPTQYTPGGPRVQNQAWPQQSPNFENISSQRRHAQDHPFHQGRQLPPASAERQGLSHSPHHLGGYQQTSRKPYNNTAQIATPPRPRGQRIGHSSARQPTPGNPGVNPSQQGTNQQRSPSEILKTLLRKKACLYEPDTSRAVALVTWLVGRELAIHYGFFSRQQLQSGVHACVSAKIDSGNITRTKVNRCMQIILNSCFHYIIPRSDGTEENGEVFRASFSQTVQDDSFLMQQLPPPWNDLVVDRAAILEASLADLDERPQNKNVKHPVTPKSSPRLASVQPSNSPGREGKEGDDSDSKRAVLLCFNENVRSAQDVFRCHSEFIRDTANAAGLQLGAQEWRAFFGKEAASAPYLWGSVGIPIPSPVGKNGASLDVFGQFTKDEAANFRTTWCAKRYEHDHELCGFGHVEVNGGWLRRNPAIYAYVDEMCEFVSPVTIDSNDHAHFILNECPNGVHCQKAHSKEELMYHPNRYKSKNCKVLQSRSGVCRLGDVCPHLHPADLYKPSKKSNESRFHGPRYQKKHEPAAASSKAPLSAPTGSPIMYASPAPFSSFERQLGMPGLQSLFRRNCSVKRAHVRSVGGCQCAYSGFGDDWGITNGPREAPAKKLGLPQPRDL